VQKYKESRRFIQPGDSIGEAMQSEGLTSLLRLTAAGERQRTAACPDDHQIAAYVDGTLEPRDCEQLELHLADCTACTGLVGILSKQSDIPAIEPVPELALERARRSGKKALQRWKHYVPHLTAAAAVLFSVSILIHFAQVQGPATESQVTPEQRVTRSALATVPQLQVLSPSAGMTVNASELVFRWTKIPGSRFYEVRIVTESGELVSERRVVDAEWRPTGEVHFRPGAEYFFRVDAYPSEARTLSSDHIPFRIANQP
jgi:hypothetical protein